MIIFRQITKDLFREKTRIVLTILAIAWATFAIASMLAIGEGLRLTFAQTVANTGSNLLTLNAGRTSKPYRGMHTGAIINLTRIDFAAIEQLPNIAVISPSYNYFAKIKYGTKNLDKQLLAVRPNYAEIHEIKTVLPGRFISPLDIARQRAVVVLGTQTSEQLFPKIKNPVGLVVRIGAKPFTVIGVMQHKSQMMARHGADAFMNWIPVSTYLASHNPQKIDSIDITFKDAALLPQLQSWITKIVAINHSVDPNDENVVHFHDYAARQDKINTFFLGMQIFLGIVGVFTLLVAGVGIANVMFASISRATHEIGVRMAVGAKTYHIVSHYVTEAMAATFLGGILGLLMSSLLVYGLRRIPMHGKLFQVIGQPKPVLSFLVIVVVIAVLGCTGFLAGLFPALKAARIDPSEALSYE